MCIYEWSGTKRLSLSNAKRHQYNKYLKTKPLTCCQFYLFHIKTCFGISRYKLLEFCSFLKEKRLCLTKITYFTDIVKKQNCQKHRKAEHLFVTENVEISWICCNKRAHKDACSDHLLLKCTSGLSLYNFNKLNKINLFVYFILVL